jgi:hypothetical protein
MHTKTSVQVRRALPILDSGNCEPFKAAVHATALGLSALMGCYNAAAWLRRRQNHLAVNAVLYLTAVIWEQRHVAHHLAACACAAKKESALPEAVPVSDTPLAA